MKPVKQICISFLLSALTCSICSCALGQKRLNYKYVFQDEIQDVRESVNRGSLREAEQNLSMLLEMDPGNRDARLLRGISYQKAGQYERAIEDYLKLIEDHPDTAKAHYNLAMIYAFKTGDKGSALKHFDIFLTLNIKSPKAFDVAKIMCSLDGEKSGRKNIDQFFADWSLEKASSEKDPKTRKNRILDSINLNPSKPESYLELAKDLESKGNNIEAIEYYKRAIATSPTFAAAHQQIGQLLQSEGKDDEASIHFAKAALFSPNNR